MKHEKLFSCLWAMALSVGLALSGIGCLVTAFDLQTASLGGTALWLTVWAAAFAPAFTWKKALIPAAVLALLAGYGWVEGTLFDSVELLLEQVSTYYSMGYGWPIVQLSNGLHPAGTVTWALCALGTVTAALTCRAVCGKKSSVPAVLSGVLPLCACLLVTDKVPDTGWLFALLLFLGLLVLPQTLRRRSPVQANRLTAMILVPAVLAMGLLYVLVPQEGYNKQSLGDRFVQQWDRLWGKEEDDPGTLVSVGGGAVSLSSLGSRSESMRPVMEVTWDRSGSVYLRTCAYDTYYNNVWTNLAVPETLEWPAEYLLEDGGYLQIQTRNTLDLRAFPYYPEGDVLADVTRGISNYSGQQSYSYSVQLLSNGYLEYEDPSPGTQTAYTQLPAVTYAWAQQLVQELVEEDMPFSQKAQIIGEAVSGCAQYDLKTRKMSADAKDFAQWFYEESETGYCIHFATTAAVLLRAAGIPARYVTGYLVTVQAGVETTVYEKNAHAWVEYWLPGVGWVPLEATPAAALEEQIAPPETTAPEETVPREQSPEAPQTPEQTPEQPEVIGQWRSLFWLWIPGAVLALAGALVLQWRIRVVTGKRRRTRGGRNRRGIEAWRELTRLTAVLGTQPEQAVFLLAQKAKFSQHSLTEAELDQLEAAIQKARQTLKTHAWYRRLYYCLALALY